ncbi:MAG: DUF1501 domain-containing protein [Acidobacteriota bacterium]
MPATTRRSFLRTLSGALALPAVLPHGLARMAFAAHPENRATTGDVLVCLFQRGGSDGLHLIVPYGDTHYRSLRPTLALGEPGSTKGTLDLDGFFGLHPALAPLAELWQDGLLAPVHAVGSPEASHSHFDAMASVERGTPGNKTQPDGWIGRHLESLVNHNDSPFRGVGIGPILQASLRGSVPATALASIADFHLEGRPGQGAAEIARFQASLAKLYDGVGFLDRQGQLTFEAIARLAAADPGKNPPANGARYPASELGLALQQVGQMIKADLGMEVACLDAGGWDTHASQGGSEGQMAGLLGDLASSLQAFATDLADRIGRITVVVMSEFGRRAHENASGGTDHGEGNCMLLLGGGIVGGRVHGRWPGLAPAALSGPGDLAATTDFRTVLAEIVERRLGNPAIGEIFPGFAPPGYLGVARA